jgi:hypothetical protein
VVYVLVILAIAKWIMDSHGDRLMVESHRGRGSSLLALFPPC